MPEYPFSEQLGQLINFNTHPPNRMSVGLLFVRAIDLQSVTLIENEVTFCVYCCHKQIFTNCLVIFKYHTLLPHLIFLTIKDN